MTKNQSAASLLTDARIALSPKELAGRWGICRQSVYNMLRDGELNSFKVRNSRLIPFSEIKRIEAGDQNRAT